MKQSPYILVVNETMVRRPVFVLGAPHSGVDAVAAALRGAPGLHLTSGSPAVLRTAYGLARQPTIAAERGVGAAAMLREAFSEAWQLTFHSCPECSERSVRLGEAAETCPHGRAARRFGDASPDLLYCAPSLATAFPDAVFVQIIRDGRDAVAGMLDDERLLAWFRPGLTNLDEVFPNPFLGVESEAERERYPDLSTAAKCALRWRSTVRLSARLRAELPRERVLTLRYEEMVGGEAETAERLSSFMDAPVPATELMASSPDGIGSWRARLDAQQRADVLEVAKPELAGLGYV